MYLVTVYIVYYKCLSVWQELSERYLYKYECGSLSPPWPMLSHTHQHRICSWWLTEKMFMRRTTKCRFPGQCSSVMSQLLRLSETGHLQLSLGGAWESKRLQGAADIVERECLSNYKAVNLYCHESGRASLSHSKGSAAWITQGLPQTWHNQLSSFDHPMFPLCYINSSRSFLNSLPFYSPYHVNWKCFNYLTFICRMFSSLNGHLHRTLSRSKGQPQTSHQIKSFSHHKDV